MPTLGVWETQKISSGTLKNKMAKSAKTNEWGGAKSVGLSGWCLGTAHDTCIVEATTFMCSCECHKGEQHG
jgi:hypothetical protein